ncbi:MAG: zinc ribbon domain-containing protein [Firmicutes bacterium]|nr:zinc ribbon domain-containing protein [Alicyclobacillaceae bacterium]MCL6498092.1 zinc ribbon domain-containing protein [Bacillota bacterium]
MNPVLDPGGRKRGESPVQCPRCLETIPDDSHFCPLCGAEQPRAALADDGADGLRSALAAKPPWAERLRAWWQAPAAWLKTGSVLALVGVLTSLLGRGRPLEWWAAALFAVLVAIYRRLG